MGKQIKCRAKLYKRVIAILLVLIVLFSLSASQSYAAPTFLAENPLYPQNQRNHVYTSQNHFGGNIYSSLAFDFHIFATEVELGAHTNGNIATNILKANGHAFGADEQNHLHKREDNYIRTYASGISNIASNGNTIVGSQISLEVNKQDKRIKIGHSQNYLNQETSKKILQESKTSDPYINIEGELAYLSTLSSQLTKKETSKDVTIQSGSEITHTITVTDQGGNHYLNIQAGTFFKAGQKNILNISLPQKTTLIINVDMNQADPNILKNLVTNLNNYTNGEAIASTYCGLLWNLYDSGSSNGQFAPAGYIPVGISDYFFGTILAPNANIIYGALNGSIIANKVKQDGKESHRFDFTGYEDPSDDPTTEATTEITTEATTEGTTETTTEATTETTTEATTEGTTETTTEATTEATTETTTEATTETTTEATTEATTETTTEATTEGTTETTTEATTETTTEATTETTTEATTEATTETTTEATTETTTEATTEVTTEATTQSTTEITTQITTESTTQITTCTTEQNSGSSTQITETSTRTYTERHHARTGDDTKVFLLITITLSSLGLCSVIILYKHYKK